MIALTFQVCAEEPLLLTRLEGDPNSSVSYPYVPGSVIRGALASRYLGRHDVDLSGDSASRRLFFDGSTRFLNAYLLDSTGQRSLPTPLSIFYDKLTSLYYGSAIHDLSARAKRLARPESLGGQFCRLSVEAPEEEDPLWTRKSYLELVDPRWQITVHTARERGKGRATEKDGAVFRYQALAAGMRLGGIILAENQQDADELEQTLTAGDLWLGGSRSGGYGRVRVEKAAQAKRAWSETGETPDSLAPGDRLVLTLLSDAILRLPDGRYADRLRPVLLPNAFDQAVAPGAVFKRVAPVGGFNRYWGLPLCQVPAVQAGSVFVYEVLTPILADTLQRLETEGVGERRVEGFGRVAVNWHRDAELVYQPGDPQEGIAQPVTLSSDSQALAQRMCDRLLRRSLDRRLAGQVGSADLRITHPPSRTQLSRLRGLALNALASGETVRLLAFLLDDNFQARAREQYRRARIHEIRLLDWLGRLVLNALPSEQVRQLWMAIEGVVQANAARETEIPPVNADGLIEWLGKTAPSFLPSSKPEDLRILLLDEERRKIALRDYREPRINGARLTGLMQERLDEPQPVWRWLGPGKIDLPKIDEAQAVLSQALAEEYTIRLVAGVLHQATKERADD